jgi:hypothetical protein
LALEKFEAVNVTLNWPNILYAVGRWAMANPLAILATISYTHS